MSHLQPGTLAKPQSTAMNSPAPQMPSEIDDHLGRFDRFASATAKVVGRASFFSACVLLVVLWIPSFLVIHDTDVYQLLINTATTIITFLLVALLQNTQERSDLATQHKLNAIASALADLMDTHGLDEDSDELESAVGLEHRESSR